MDFTNLNSNLDEYHAKLIKYQSTRDFRKILETLEESPTKQGSAATEMNYICMKSYALARSGYKSEAMLTLNKLMGLSMYYNIEDLQKVFELMSFFVESDANSLDSYEKDFIIKNIDNNSFPIHIKSILFDLEDYIDL